MTKYSAKVPVVQDSGQDDFFERIHRLSQLLSDPPHVVH